LIEDRACRPRKVMHMISTGAGANTSTNRTMSAPALPPLAPYLHPSTRTVIVSTNMDFDLPLLFAGLPVCTNPRAPLARAYAGLHHGGITHVEYRQQVRGVPWKQNPRRGKRAQHFFLNSMTLVMLLDASRYAQPRQAPNAAPAKWKRINAKISHNGRFQLTGCQTDGQYRDFMENILAILTDPFLAATSPAPLIARLRPCPHHHAEGAAACGENDTCIVATFAVVMCNTDDQLGFQINRERLDTFINARTDFVSIYETSVNTSVNIKLPCLNPNDSYMLRLVWPTAQAGVSRSFQWQRKEYPAYLADWCAGSTIKWKRAYHTFLVFTSGAVIQSSKGQDAPGAFRLLVTTLRRHRAEFEEVVAT